MFSDHCSFGLYTLKSHLLDHIVKDLQACGTLYVLESPWFEKYNVNVNHAYSQTSGRRDWCMNDTMRMVGCRQASSQTDLRMLSLEGER